MLILFQSIYYKKNVCCEIKWVGGWGGAGPLPAPLMLRAWVFFFNKLAKQIIYLFISICNCAECVQYLRIAYLICHNEK